MQYLLVLVFSLHLVMFFSFTSLANYVTRSIKFVLFIPFLVLGFCISVTLMCGFCPWFEFSTLTSMCCMWVLISIHYLLYHCVFQCKTAKEMCSFFLVLLHPLQSL